MLKSLCCVLLTGLSAQSWAAPAFIKSFTPQNLSEPTNQVRAEFSTKMVDLGVNPDANIFDILCTPQLYGRANWDSETTWTFDFVTNLSANKLPGGSRCSFSLKADFKKRKKISGKTDFQFQIDGPNIITIYPGDPSGRGNYTVVEDQVFIIGLDAAVDENSVLRNVRFKVAGIASLTDIRLLPESEKTAIFQANKWLAENFKGMPTLAIQPTKPFPADKKVSLIWGKGIKSIESGLERQRELVLSYAVRPLLTAQFSCFRENAKADCSPFLPMEVSFSAEIPTELAKQIRLVGVDQSGRKIVIPAEINPEEKAEARVSRVTFSPLVKERASYRLEIPGGIKDDAGRRLANEGSFPLTIKTAEFPPLAKFASDFGVLESQVKPVLLPVTLRNLEAQVIGKQLAPAAVNGASVRINSDNFSEVVKWMKATAGKNGSWSNREKSVFADSVAKPAKFTVPLNQGGKAFEVVGVPLQDPGFYVVELQSRLLGKSLLGQNKNMYVASTALVTNMVVHSKFGRESSLFWVTSLDSGLPVSGAHVSISDCEGRSMISGTTDGDGLFRYKGELKKKINFETCSRVDSPTRFDSGFFVTAAKGEDFTFTHSSWSEGIEPFRFGNILDLSPMWSEQRTLAHTVLDRTLLRAGETVSMKHFLRLPMVNGFSIPEQARLPNVMQITHSDTGVSQTFPVTWDASGTAISEFKIPKEAKLGLYQVSLARQSGEDINESLYTSTFQVMEFKVPLMRGSISFPQRTQNLINPGKIDAQLSVTYQDGGPAINQQVKFSYRISKRYGLTYKDFGWEMNFATDRVLAKEQRSSDFDDAEVKTVEVPTRLNSKGAAVVNIPGLSGFESVHDVETQLEFTDKNSERQTVARTLTIFPSARLVAVSVANAYNSTKNIEFRAAVVDIKGRPVAGISPKFEMFERVTYTHKTKMVGGFYASESFVRTTKIKDINCQGATDNKGYLKCATQAPESGNYIIQALVQDDTGNSSYGSDSVYVRGQKRAWYPSDNNDRMDVVPEKKEYKAGEKAVLNVQMPFSQATALVTVEREGIVDAYVKRIATDGRQAIEVDIKDAYAPNIFVSVLAVRGRVTAAEPTALVDLGKPAFKLGMAQLRVNWDNNALKVSVKPSKESFKPREEASVEVSVTDVSGSARAGAEFALAVVDEGLLTLSKNSTWDLLNAMMGSRYLEVETATAGMQVVGKRHFGLKAKPSGGDGGQAPTRELFDTLVKWLPRVKTDAQGRALVKFAMNDSLSKFRIVAIAHQGVGKFGTGEAAIVTEQDIQMIPSLGTVSRNGDKYAAEFTIRNQTKSDRKVSVGGRVKFIYADGRSETKDLEAQQISLVALDSALLNMGEIEVPDGVTKTEFEVTVTGERGQIEDRIRISQEVKPSVLPRTYMAQLEQLGAQPRVIGVELPENADPKQGGIKVSLLASLAGNLETVKSEMVRYPFRSFEYLVSRAVATNDGSVWNEAMAKLPGHLDSEGLLMWYPSAATAQGSDVLTAYVLSMSYYSGFNVPEELQKRMLMGLIDYVEGRSRLARSEKLSPTDLFIRRVNVIEVLARFGRAQSAWLTSLPRLNPEQIPIASLNDLLSIYALLKQVPDRQDKITQTLNSLEARMTRIGTGLKLTDTTVRPWFILSSEDLDQAELILIASKNPDLRERLSDKIPLLVNGAVAMLKRGAWDLTCANASGVLAFRAYSQAFEKEAVSGVTEVTLAEVKKSFDWNAAGAEKGGSLLLGWPSVGLHNVSLSHKGVGTPWAIVAVDAAVRLSEKLEKHIGVEKTVSPLKETYKKGDIITVTLKLKPQTELPFVSIMDPIPAGAKILGSGLDNDRDEGPITQGWAWPDYQELTYDSYRASYRSLPAEGISVVYRLQLNNAGTFKVPSTRVEAIYMPENFAEVPNADVKIEP